MKTHSPHAIYDSFDHLTWQATSTARAGQELHDREDRAGRGVPRSVSPWAEFTCAAEEVPPSGEDFNPVELQPPSTQLTQPKSFSSNRPETHRTGGGRAPSARMPATGAVSPRSLQTATPRLPTPPAEGDHRAGGHREDQQQRKQLANTAEVGVGQRSIILADVKTAFLNGDGGRCTSSCHLRTPCQHLVVTSVFLNVPCMELEMPR